MKSYILKITVKKTGDIYLASGTDFARVVKEIYSRIRHGRLPKEICDAGANGIEIQIIEEPTEAMRRSRLAFWKSKLQPPLNRGNSKKWENIDWNRRNVIIAADMNVTPSTAEKWRKLLGKPKAPRLQSTLFDGVDWNMQDARIAEQVGCSRERARQVRVELGKPKALRHGRQKPRFTEAQLKLLGTAPDFEIAKKLGCSPDLVGIYRRANGIAAINPHHCIWSAELIAKLGTASDREIAKQFGVSTMAVCRKRQSLGIKSCTEQYGNYQTRRGVLA